MQDVLAENYVIFDLMCKLDMVRIGSLAKSPFSADQHGCHGK